MALLYADDLVLLAENEDSLRRLVMCFEKTTQESGLTINVAKTKQLITLPDRRDPENRLNDVDQQGSCISNDSYGYASVWSGVMDLHTGRVCPA